MRRSILTTTLAAAALLLAGATSASAAVSTTSTSSTQVVTAAAQPGVADDSANSTTSATTSAAAACGTSTVKSTGPYSSATGRSQGLLELRYSSCNRTAWARVSTGLPACKPGVDYCGNATVHRNSDGAEKYCSIPGGSTSCYTASVSDAGVTSYAKGYVDNGAYSYYGQTASY